MGYSTEFEGTLQFTHELSVPQLKKLHTFFGANPREHPEWGLSRDHGYIDLELAKDYSGIKWDGAEKTRDLDKSVAFIIREMRKEWPEFGLTGTLKAQGEDVEDRWDLVVDETGAVSKNKRPPPGVKVKCPHCRRDFYYSPDNGSENSRG